MKKAFATNLRKARLDANLKQHQVAMGINKKLSTYQAYEEGRAYPPADDLVLIAEYFNISDLRRFISDPDYKEGAMQDRAIRPESILQSNYTRLSKKDRAIVDILLGLREIE